MSGAETAQCIDCGTPHILPAAIRCSKCGEAVTRIRLVAPELLEALEGLLKHGGDHLDELSFRGGGNSLLRVAVMRARAALAKARGHAP